MTTPLHHDAPHWSPPETIDVTQYFKELAESSLNHESSMLFDPESFNLHDSMAALEVMDPSMDCCEFQAPIKRLEPPSAIDDTLLGPALPWDDLTVSDVAFVAVEALVRLASLLDGSSAAESTFTFMYVHFAVLQDMRERLDIQLEPTPRMEGTASQMGMLTLALGLLKVNETLHALIKQGDIYEEEDFNLNTYGLEFTNNSIAYLNQISLDNYHLMVEHVRLHLLPDKDPNPNIIINVLTFFQLLMDTCSSLAKMNKDNVILVAQEAKHKASLAHNQISFLKDSLNKLPKNKNKDRQHFLKSVCFDVAANRRLLGNTPVRQVNLKPVDEALELLSTLTNELEWATSGITLDGASSLRRTLNMMKRISSANCNILSRSCLVLNLFFDDMIHGQHELGPWVAKCMVEQGVSKAVMASEFGVVFVSRVGKPVYDVIKLLSMNRCRQRAAMENYIFSDWIKLQKEANAVDYYYRMRVDPNNAHSPPPPYVTNWVFMFTVWLMEHYLLLSIELGLVHEHQELAYTFWYLNFLFSAQLNVMSTMKKTDEPQFNTSKSSNGNNDTKPQGRGARRRKGKNSTTSKATSNIEEGFLLENSVESDVEHLFVGVKRSLCRGIFQVSKTGRTLLLALVYLLLTVSIVTPIIDNYCHVQNVRYR